MFSACLLINVQKRDGQQLPFFFRQPGMMVRMEKRLGIREASSEDEHMMVKG